MWSAAEGHVGIKIYRIKQNKEKIKEKYTQPLVIEEGGITNEKYRQKHTQDQ